MITNYVDQIQAYNNQPDRIDEPVKWLNKDNGFFAEELQGYLPGLISEIKLSHVSGAEQLDTYYREIKVLAGISKVLTVSYLVPILDVMVFCADYARWKETYAEHSLSYVVELLGNAIIKDVESQTTAQPSGLDVPALLEEAINYLKTPLQEWSEEAERLKNLSDDFGEEEDGEDTQEDGAEAPAKPAKTTVQDFSSYDEVENLALSDDKVGMLSEFCEECNDNLQQVELALIDLENSSDPGEVLNEIFRSVHTVKGGARLIEIRKIEVLSHSFENILDECRSKPDIINAELIDLFLECQTRLSAMIQETENSDAITSRVSDLLERLAKAGNGETAKPMETANKEGSEAPATATPPAASSPGNARKTEESIRVSAVKLDEVLNTASEVFITRIRLQSDIERFKDSINQLNNLMYQFNGANLPGHIFKSSLDLDSLEADLFKHGLLKSNQKVAQEVRRKIQLIKKSLNNEIGFTLADTPEAMRLEMLKINETGKALQKNIEDLGSLSTNLQTGAMNFRMVPIRELFNRFPSQVRDMARKSGKKINLKLGGTDTELDKVLINQLTDPLIHILRNSIDHGIETPADRLAAGKTEDGQINLDAFYEGSNAVIQIKDDGNGINVDKVLARAIERNLVSEDRVAELSRQEILNFIFEPGFSTVAKVTELSGRGVGMDVVKTSITSIQGMISIESEEGKGTVIQLTLPLTLAVVGILLIEENGRQFALPILNVFDILTIDREKMRQVGDNRVFNHRGRTVIINSLSKILDFPQSHFDSDQIPIVVVTDGTRYLGILVDTILGQQDVLIKQTGTLANDIDLVMGCTILSDSRLVLVLNVWELITQKETHTIVLDHTDEGIRSARGEKKILVVDDSALQRKRVKEILNGAGYEADLAADAITALTMTKETHYDALCVDIIMPVMDGIEFVGKLRNNEQYKSTPVYMISGVNLEQGNSGNRLNEISISGFLSKPIDADALIGSLDNSLL